MSSRTARRSVGARRAVRGHGPRSAQPGVCSACGCTDEWGCDEGCAWANTEHTLCTACVPLPALTAEAVPANELARYLLEDLLPSFVNCPACAADSDREGCPFAAIVHKSRCKLAAKINAYARLHGSARCRVEGSKAR